MFETQGTQNQKAPSLQGIDKKLTLLPEKPGVYLFKDQSTKIIYIGKAKVLKNRVWSYFLESNTVDPRSREFIKRTRDVDWFITLNDTEAMILEDQLIKLHRPRFNIRLKDQKTYPYLKLSVGELYPRLTLCRKIEDTTSLYFGPYPVRHEAVSVMKVIQKYFPLRLSKMSLDGTKTFKPCLNYQLQRCLAPCNQHVSIENYAQMTNRVKLLLRGKFDDLLQELQDDMLKKSESLEYEAAARIRDQIKATRKILSARKIVSRKPIDCDLLALARNGSFAGVQTLFVRKGALIGSDFIFLKNGEEHRDQEIFRATISRLYINNRSISPPAILTSSDLEDAETLKEYFQKQRHLSIPIFSPKSGEKKQLIEMAFKNAEENLRLKLSEATSNSIIVEQVQQQLHLKHLPKRAECFDISNISGTHTVAAMTVVENNRPVPKEYKKYKVKTVSGIDDFASLFEVLGRRMKRGLSNEWPFPDLMIIDGGKGQLKMAERILENYGISRDSFDLIALAKGRTAKKRGATSEEFDVEYIVKPGQKNPIPLKKHSASLHFLQRIRNEAHRIAISYHRHLRDQQMKTSILDKIPHIGPAKKKKLLLKFGSLQKIKNASFDALIETPLISPKDAETLRNFFVNDQQTKQKAGLPNKHKEN